MKLGRLALDGTKIKAFSEIASRHGLSSNRALSYGRMQTEEVRLQQEIRDWLVQAEAEDQARLALAALEAFFDAVFGFGRAGIAGVLLAECPAEKSGFQKSRTSGTHEA